MVTDTDTTTTTDPPFGLDPADANDRYMTTAIHPSVHILAVRPDIKFDGLTFPGFTIAVEGSGRAAMTLSLTGGPTSRAAFVADLRSVADQIERWSK